MRNYTGPRCRLGSRGDYPNQCNSKANKSYSLPGETPAHATSPKVLSVLRLSCSSVPLPVCRFLHLAEVTTTPFGPPSGFPRQDPVCIFDASTLRLTIPRRWYAPENLLCTAATGRNPTAPTATHSKHRVRTILKRLEPVRHEKSPSLGPEKLPPDKTQ